LRSDGCLRRHDRTDPDLFWLNRDYLPEYFVLQAGRPSLTELARAVEARVEPVVIPWDCADGFYEAYWRRPEAYLDEHVRRGISIWARVGPDAEQRAVRSLRDDLASGRWAERNRDLVGLDVAEPGRLCSERSFTRLCGVAPVRRPPAAPDRHRCTAAAIATPAAPWGESPWSACTATSPPRTRSPGGPPKAGKEILRCLKRHIAPRDLSPPASHASLGGPQR